MSKTILSQVDGFTPVIDDIVTDAGLIAAAIFGKVWRYCQMPDGICTASQERIANELGLERETVCRYLDKLVEAGYLSVNKIAGKPNEYTDTGKAGLRLSITGNGGGCDPRSQVPVTLDHTKRVLKIQEEELNHIDGVAKPTPPAQKSKPKPTPEEAERNKKAKLLIDTFTEISDIKPITRGDWGKWQLMAKYLTEHRVTPDDLKAAFYHERQYGKNPISWIGSIKARAISQHREQ